MKKPYSFPLRSRAAMVAYLLAKAGNGRHYHGETFPFVWNVKTHSAGFDSESLRSKCNSDAILEPRFDAQWQDVIDADSELFWRFCEDAARYLSDGEWTSYPGSDQGDWELSFAGRCGGWLVLEKWRGIDLTRVDLSEWLSELSFADLRAFYRGIVCADQDFTPAKAATEVMYQAAFYRDQLEDGWKAAETKAARIWEQSRPDMYPQATA